MHTRLFDVLHDTANKGAAGVGSCTRIADAIHITFNGVIQKAVQQHWRVMADLDGLAHVTLQITLLVHDFHGTAAQHIAGAHHERVAEGSRFFKGLRLRASCRVGRLAQAQFMQQFLETLPVLRCVNHVR